MHNITEQLKTGYPVNGHYTFMNVPAFYRLSSRKTEQHVLEWDMTYGILEDITSALIRNYIHEQ